MKSQLETRYRPIRELAAGGFGKTFLVEDTQMPSQRLCVMKQLKPVTGNPQILQLLQERFAREAAILEALGDPIDRIPKLYAYFEVGGQFYLVQEWIEGATLTEKVEGSGPLTETEVRSILLSLLSVLELVHGQGIVHRDIKPDNVILRQADGQPVLIDFGAVKEIMGTQVTSQGHSAPRTIAIGTPGYMPPEQAAGRPVYASDLYSLALTAVYLLTGKTPAELETNLFTGKIGWRDYALNVSDDLASVLDRAIQPTAGDRFCTATEMLAALTASVKPLGTISATQLSPAPRQTKKKSSLWQKGAIVSSLISTFVICISLIKPEAFAFRSAAKLSLQPPQSEQIFSPMADTEPEVIPEKARSPIPEGTALKQLQKQAPKPIVSDPTPAIVPDPTPVPQYTPNSLHLSLSGENSKEQLDELADRLYYARYPELQGTKIQDAETKLAREWTTIRKDIEREVDRLTEKLFRERHPELAGRKNRPSELRATREKIKQCDAVVDYIFYLYHPELAGRKIQSEEMELAREWSEIKQQVSSCH
ncbi:MAG: protein kinase [Hormoscilla sp.]